MKDRYQKLKLIKFFLSQRWYPQMEVDVLCNSGVAVQQKAITDIDVLGLIPTGQGKLSMVIGDCKTLKGQSPVNRALWLKGLMDHFQANSGIIVLSKAIEGDHKHFANDLDITMLSDADFENYIKYMNVGNIKEISAISNGDCWDSYFGMKKDYPDLEQLLNYSKSGFWNEENESLQIRHLLSKLATSAPYLNPSNAKHLFLFLELTSLFAIALGQLTMNIFNRYLLPTDKSFLEQELKSMIWGGKENYKFWNKMNNKLKNIEGEVEQLELPEWQNFIKVIMSCLENPMEMSFVPLILKENAFECLVTEAEWEKCTLLNGLCNDYRYAAKTAIIIIDYLRKACGLPKEFSDFPTKRIMSLQSR